METFIKVNDNYRIFQDTNGFTLEKRNIIKKEDGIEKESWNLSGYNSNVMQCLYKVLSDTEIEQGDTLTAYMERFEEMYKHLYIDRLGKIIQQAKER